MTLLAPQKENSDLMQQLGFDAEPGFYESERLHPPAFLTSSAQTARAHSSRCDSPTAAQVKFLADIRIPLTIEIGQLAISAAELLDLVEGQVFQFPFDPQKPLRLCLDGEEIARVCFVLEEDQSVALEIVDVCTSLKD